jgi:hypothetical protein
MNSRRTRLRTALSVTLTVLILVPSGFLFARDWQENAAKHDSTQLEQQGVEYLATLAPLVSALTEFQSSALQGIAEPPDSLAPAVSRVAAVDARLGDALQTKQRWAGLQDKIGKLANAPGTPLEIVQAHTEVTDLTLALYDAVRRNAELNRDPDNDISNLQQAVAADMPTTIFRISLAGDFANVLQTTTGQVRAAVSVRLGQAMLDEQEAVDSLTDNLQSAVDETHSVTLSGSLVSTLDAFRRGVESMARGINPGELPQVATITTAQSTLQTALDSLSGVTLKEMGRLLDDRMNTLSRQRYETIGAGALVVLLVLGAVLLQVLGRRPQVERPTLPAAGSDRAALDPPPGGTAYGDARYDQSPGYGEDSTRRERFGALR